MKKIIKNQKTKGFTGMAIALALIVFGAIMIGVTFTQFNNATKSTQDQQLRKVESAVDYNINESIVRFERQMEYLLQSKRFDQVIDRVGQGAGSDSLTDVLMNSSLSGMATFEALFVTKDGEVIGTSSADEEYTIGSEIREGLNLCQDTAGNEYLAVGREAAKDTMCYGVMNIKALYENILPRTNAERASVELLLADGQTLVYESNTGVRTCLMSGIGEAVELDVNEADILYKTQESGESTTGEYEKNLTKEQRAATRVLAVPSDKTANKAFAIAVTVDYSAMASLMKTTIMKVILFFILAAAGIIMLVMFLIQMRRERTQVDEEIERLKEKNKQMEELNTKLQELEHHQRLETIGTMTSGIAHEFNNLLAPIMGYSIMTLEKIPPEDEALYDGVLEIYNASKKAKDIISRLSDLARKNTEKVFTRIPPDTFVNRTISVTAPSLPNNVDLVRDFHCNGKYMRGNETQLSQLLINLVINAFHALSEKGGTVTIRTEVKDGFVVLTVSDDGPGIPKEIQESIFEPFFTTKEAGAGTGLGLAIVRQAAEDHGGRVELESEEGNGCCFRVYIPEDVPDEVD